MKIEILWLLNLQIIYIYAMNCKEGPQCLMTRSHKMKTADCYNREFREFPQCLTSDVEVIDLGYNRIRKITRSDLSKFSSLKFLYLGDNLISKLDKDLFEDAYRLTTLDLSLNAIVTIPPSIFHLPYLNSLYLKQNLNIDIVQAVEDASPVTSPLIQIDISKTTDIENPTNFPNFGLMPLLTTLNVTGNFYFNVTPGLFMGLCNLQKLINDNVTVAFNDTCDCWRLNYWLETRGIQFTRFICLIAESQCSVTLNDEDLQLFSQCNIQFEAIKRSNLLKSICIGVGATAAVIIILSFLIFLYCRKNRKHKNKQTKTLESIGDDSPLRRKTVENIYK
ncbi:leucine-rich repeats and immunoglobulin-like domains protein 2 isoform X2 [Diabrotica virgifera virgifera]|uniref:Leucine-rich repeats and immunoglobulin-like domains protein 2 n=1 Tax=Diabrotica virgifera virgifera TaxID=50390 RepID=A0A6P7GKW4_DIAVI|nr:leucine-rich repeats and immunoglobulin-like domains protein 2 isoform X2 [Diabrotica virgifera virgifera]